jgi:hypothetical protein
LMSLNPELEPAEFPAPTWVFDDIANCRAQSNPEERDAQLFSFGYTPVAKPIGFERAWENSNPAYYPYIVLSEKYSHNSKNYFVLKDGGCVERSYSVSYRRLLEILAEPLKESRRSRRDTAEVEDYDYDRSDYIEVDYQEDDE